jgi:RND family efflux transporter MFP subunit
MLGGCHGLRLAFPPQPVRFLALALACTACGPRQAPEAPQAAAAPVGVAAPIVRETVDWDEYTGRFIAVERVDVRARVSGYLQEISVRDGQRVSAGDQLFLIDPRPYEAALDAASAELLAAEARLRNAAAEAERASSLVERRVISTEDYEARITARLEAAAAADAARARRRAAELDLEFTRVTAPIDGRVSDRRVSVGNLVSGGTEGATLLTTIISSDPIYFQVEASEAQYLRYARLGIAGERPRADAVRAPVQIRLADETGWPHEGRIDFIEPQLDPETSTLRGRAVVPNPDGLFTPGLFATMRIAGTPPYQATLVPDTVVLADQAGRFVWVAEGAMAEQRFVELGPLLDDGMRVIRSGLDPDDRVIVQGLMGVRPGVPIAPSEVSMPSADAAAAAGDASPARVDAGGLND